MDVKTSFLNREIEQAVYIEQPEGFVIHGKESHVCKLKKDLYGLKQALRDWYIRIGSFLQSLGFSKSIGDPNIYINIVKNHPVILVLYVDDLFLTGGEHMIAQAKSELPVEFEVKDLSLMHYFLGLEVWQKPGEIFLSQGKYVVDCWASKMSYFHPPFPSLFLTFHRPINLPSYHFHKYMWVSPYYFPLYSFQYYK
jgi:hypothetical protein